MRTLAILWAGAALLLAGCTESTTPLQVGSKDFTESLILGELIAQIAERENIPVARSIPYGGTFDNIEALKRGDIDVYPEYNGTGLVLLGQPPISDGDQAYARVVELYRPLGLVWGERLGFHNDYELVMRADRADELGVATISDLAALGEEIPFGIDDEFAERPIDGFGALQRRYGLSAAAAVVAEDTTAGKARLYEALLEGEVDVVEGFSTDGQIAEYGLVVLEDDLGFFPTYQPAPLVRAEAGERFPRLIPALGELAGRLTTEDMRAMNAAVDLDGQDPKLVASRFLAENQMIGTDPELLVAEELVVALGGLETPTGQSARVLAAVRKSFPGRSVTTLETPDPIAELTAGRARVAVAGAEAFFRLGDDVFPEPRGGAEALGVAGHDVAHLLVQDGGPRAIGEVARLGVGPAGGGSERTARMVLSALGLLEGIEPVSAAGTAGEALEAQAAALADGDLDALFVMAAVGHPRIAELAGEGRLRILPLPEWQEGNHLIRFPFLRVSRIAAGTYQGQDEPVDTLGAQVVLAGPAASTSPIGTAGPGSAAIGEILPLADKTVLALNQNLETGELLDPALPSAAILRPQPRPAPASISPSAAHSVVNFIVICVIVYLVYLYFRRGPVRRRPAGRGAGDRPAA